MTETAPDSFTLVPLAADSLPPAVAKVMGGPAAAKLLVAKGIAPLRPPDLALAVYQLSFDEDAAMKAAADGAPASLPDKLLVPALGEPLPAGVLHFFALRLPPARVEPLEKVLYNQATADATFAALAARLDERELEVICQNEARLLRCPAIVQALYFNKRARMSSVNRAIELCARNGVSVEGVPAFDEIAAAITEDASATTPAVDRSFESALAASEGAEPPPEGEPTAEPTTKRSAVIDFSKLKLYEKIRLATLGNAYCRQTLLRDSNRLVAMAAIRSPLITDSEVTAAAASRNVSEDVIRYIANQRDFMKLYAVKQALVNNPKCPIAFSLRLLPALHAKDVEAVARSKNIPTALAVAARRLVQARRPGG